MSDSTSLPDRHHDVPESNHATLRQRQRIELGRAAWADRLRTVRSETERRAKLLSPEDQVIQSMADASPTKWHRAHTSWFFEQFLLIPYADGYQALDERYLYLFNSYYVAAGPRHARPKRGLITRPSVEEVSAYRAHIDEAVAQLVLGTSQAALGQVLEILEIGLQHEQQHQELILTDILHAFSENPSAPAYDETWRPDELSGSNEDWVEIEGIHGIGDNGRADYAFDNEGPAHQVLIQPLRVARQLVTNREWLAFMDDGGYESPRLWLSDGWATVEAQGWRAPGYWQQRGGEWWSMTLGGMRPVDPAAPVCHVSYYEADAFARWAGKDLPTEAEWEVAARTEQLDTAFGSVWQWTRSAYAPYPGFRPRPGALGEYNGKFMVNQMVLRGSSLATPDHHSRVTYRNFFYPLHRWQFSGLRLAQYI